jgi:hypothetical protein
VPLSVNGVELSPGSRSLAPGQRARLPVPPVRSAICSIGEVGLVSPEGRPGVKVLKVVEISAIVPLASWIPEVPKSLN